MARSNSENLRDANPFPATAVAVLGQAGFRYPTIETAAVLQTRNFLRDYLSRSSGDKSHDQAGSVVAIVGEYGTGKTHLAISILDSVRESERELIKSFYLDAPADTFVALYRDRFVPRLSKREIREQIENYLREVLAERLQKNTLTAPAAAAIRSSELSPTALMDQLGLIESDLMADLRTKLAMVTEREDYAAALSLFVRPDFEDAVWEWLCGNPPDPALVERGVVTSIDTESGVLEAMGVMAFLFGRAGRRFVLVIDEMEKVLTTASGREIDQATLLAFKKFMEAVAHTRSLLVLIGLPDFLEALPEDARQRMSAVVRPSPLGSSDIVAYIKHANQIAAGKSQLRPFSADSANYIAEITGGNARKVVRMCFLAYQSAFSSNGPVTRATVREVAREQFEASSNRDAASEIVRVLDGAGWAYDVDTEADPGGAVAAFWMPVGGSQDGILVLVSRSILHENDVEVLGSVVSARVPQSRRRGSRLILVVNGFLAESHAEVARKVFDRVLVFSDREFRENFEAVARGFRQQLETANTGDLIGHLAERIEQVGRQLTYLVDVVERLEGRSTSLEPAAVAGALRGVFAELGRTSDSVPGYGPVFDVIERVENALSVPALSSRFHNLVSYSDHEPLRREIRNFRESVRGRILGFSGTPKLLREISDVCRDYDRILDRAFSSSMPMDPEIHELVTSLPREVYYAVDRIGLRPIPER